MKQRKLLEYGFVAYNGTRWIDLHVDRYNTVQKRINKFIRIEGSAPEQLLNESHRLFVSFSQLD